MSWSKILFLHIPKTAGSSFNEIFKTAVPDGYHFPHLEGKNDVLVNALNCNKKVFASGHFTFDALNMYIERDDVFSITILREPGEQFLSHLRWVKYVGSPSYPSPESVAPPILDLAQKLHEAPLSDAECVWKIIDTPIGRQLFDNLQVRYLTNAKMSKVEEHTLSQAIINSYKFSMIFMLDEIVMAIASLKRIIPDISDLETQNTARIGESFDFNNESTHALIYECTRFDKQLYNMLEMQRRRKIE